MTDLVPSEFYLGQNYPEPFRAKTTIKYCVAYGCRVVLTIYDSGGKEVERLVDEQKSPGTYEVVWGAGGFPCGSYAYQLTAGSYTAMKRMRLTK